jgi:hypothetical protein
MGPIFHHAMHAQVAYKHHASSQILKAALWTDVLPGSVISPRPCTQVFLCNRKNGGRHHEVMSLPVTRAEWLVISSLFRMRRTRCPRT